MTKSRSFIQNLFKPFERSTKRDESREDLEKIAAEEQRHFSFDALAVATNNFHQSQKLGEGGFGPVFKGTLKDGREVAVKRLSQRSGQGKKEFQNEAKLLARVQHKNVVNFAGYCVHGSERLLVYEYVPNESLDKFLFKPGKRQFLQWKQRHDVIAGVAKGLLYLHEQAPLSIIHRDIKASNILLDEKWVPKIADFGMARLFADGHTHVNTHVAGTNGYMAPEYLLRGMLSKKADVFSFGVVVLELISGQRNSTFNRDPDCHSLLEWAYKMYKKQRSSEIIDPTLASSADHEQVELWVHIGLLCVQSESQSRPDMNHVVMMLSRKPNRLDEPTRPAYFRPRDRRHSGQSGPTVTGTSDVSSSGSHGSVGSRTATMITSTSTFTGPRLDPHGKRPMED